MKEAPISTPPQAYMNIISSLNYRPPRLGRNPKTGEKVKVPAKYMPHFKTGKELRERVILAAGK